MSIQNIFTFKIGGQAGQGIKLAGLVLAKIATRSGYFTFDHTEYPSLIRGGHNVMQISVSDEEVTAPFKKTDFLIALNQETVDKYLNQLEAGASVLYDDKDGINNSNLKLFPIPLSKLVADLNGREILKNTIAIGATLALTGGDLEILKSLIEAEFIAKSQLIVINQQAAQAGYDYALEKYKNNLSQVLAPKKNLTKKIIVNGNEAVALGAIASNMQFSAIYPMSPISGVIQVLASLQEKFGYIYKQPEDEIAAINMAIGASFAGARSLTVTSGGGFCLMAEGLGLSAMTETPLVVVEGMRAGPATGLPTWSEQGDLLFVLNAHQSDFPKIVLAPGDAQETFYLTAKAFNLAAKYQLPVIILIDKNICESDQSFFPFEGNLEIEEGKLVKTKQEGFERFALSADGISPRTIPGVGNFLIANSDEHNTLGYSSDEIKDREEQMRKRMSKMETIIKTEDITPVLHGPEKADLTIVSWGSNKGVVLQAIKQFDNVNFLQINWLHPFPSEQVKSILNNSSYLLDLECNYSAQLAQLIRQRTGLEITDKLLKYDGRPFFVEEIIQKINSFLKK